VEVESATRTSSMRADVPQRAMAKRSSYYSDYTFGVGPRARRRPIGAGRQGYFGFTDEELLQIDRFVRRNTTEKFGPVRPCRA